MPLHPNLLLTPDLAYILGVLKGDGYCYKTKTKKKTDSILGLSVNDLEFAESFANAVLNIGLVPRIRNLDKYKSCTTKWRVTAYSHEFVTWYKKLFLSDIFSLIDRKQLFLAFFKGVYESDGSLWQEREGYQRWGKPRARLTITNSDQYLCKKLREQLSQYGFDFNLYSQTPKKQAFANFTKQVFILVLQKREQIKLLLEEVNPCIIRKSWR